jgi:hypothetical protein
VVNDKNEGEKGPTPPDLVSASEASMARVLCGDASLNDVIATIRFFSLHNHNLFTTTCRSLQYDDSIECRQLTVGR